VDNPVDYFFNPGLTWPGEEIFAERPHMSPEQLRCGQVFGFRPSSQPPNPPTSRYRGFVAADAGKLPAAGNAAAAPAVEVRRSARRRRTVSAYREGDRTIVLIPAQMTAGEEERWVRTMVDRLDRRDRRTRVTETSLHRRAVALSDQYYGGRARPVSVRWVGNQSTRWGSCTPVDRTIRISERVRDLPDYVIDYVLLHELAHLLVPNHGPEFWALLESYPRTERARGYLEGYSRAPDSEQQDRLGDDDRAGSGEDGAQRTDGAVAESSADGI
jgi:hypothetical protein